MDEPDIAGTGGAASQGVVSGGAFEEDETIDAEATGSAIASEPGIEESRDEPVRSVSPQAQTEHFVNLPQIEGEHQISGGVTSWDTTDSTIATFGGGKILGHDQGVATVTLHMAGGNVEVYRVSVYFKYPQPKSSIIYPSGGGERMLMWGKVGNSDYTSPARVLVAGERITLLWRAHDQDDTGRRVYQYARTSDGKEGYVDDAWSSDRPMGGYFGGVFGFGYYNDVAVGGSTYIGSTSGGVRREDSTSWSSSDTSVMGISEGRDQGYDGQGHISGIREGYAIATTVFEYDNKAYRSSEGITVYTRWAGAGVAGNAKTAAYVKSGAYADAVAVQKLATGAAVSISGVSGGYYRIGQAQYVPKSAIAIPATGIAISPATVQVSSKGEGKWRQMAATLQPMAGGASVSTSRVAWSVSDTRIATVDGSGKLTGIKEGSTTVTAAADGVTANAVVTVKNIPVNKITLNKTSLLLAQGGGAFTLKATVSPDNAYNRKLVWSASPSGIVSISDKGGNACEVKAIKYGKATVTAATPDGSVSAVCSVEVPAIALPGSASYAGYNTLPMTHISERKESGNGKYMRNKITFGYVRYEDTPSYENGFLRRSLLARYYVLKRRPLEFDSKGKIKNTKYTTVETDDITKKIDGNQTVPLGKSIWDNTAKKGTSYMYRLEVKKYKNSSTTLWCDTVSFVHGKAVSGLAAEAVDRKSIRLTWKKSNSCDGYYIYQKTKSGYKYIDAVTGRCTYTVSGLKANKRYEYVVYAYNRTVSANSSSTMMHRGDSVKESTNKRRTIALNIQRFTYSDDKKKVTRTIRAVSVKGARYYSLMRSDKPDKDFKEYATRTLNNGAAGQAVYLTENSASDAGGTYYYRVIASSKKGAKTLTRTTLIVNGDANGNKKGIPSVSLEKATPDSYVPKITLKWKCKNSSGIDGYRIYRSKDGKTYAMLSTEKKSAKTKTDIVVSSSTKYYYRVSAYGLMSDATNGLYMQTPASKMSGAKSCKTAAKSVANATMDYFRKNWASTVDNDKKNNTKAVQYKLAKGADGTSDLFCDLQIHLYIRFTDSDGGAGHDQANFISGVQEMWSGRLVTNTNNDFPNKDYMLFQPIVIVHTESKVKGQEWITVQLGGDCPSSGCIGDLYMPKYWYHAHPDENIIYMPADASMKGNPARYNALDIDDYRYCAGHEMGHIFGLGDAYYLRYYIDSGKRSETGKILLEEKQRSRLVANEETTQEHGADIFGFGGLHDNIMSNEHEIHLASSNDIEMALYAYQKGKQYYRDYTDPRYGNDSYSISHKIINKREVEGWKHN
ncbi:MAG: Ig-like domain-containing protein [Clostridiales Family XIII bacterium]|nr:Ig-like domain-containing protein [Clostridiales Family XIII bacterium]